ncbi:hypothetical protein AND4_13340 [Vibrio sp. AND4]|nr:hypothetical protein AND4_13340 [Vibrio sp. AND4]
MERENGEGFMKKNVGIEYKQFPIGIAHSVSLPQCGYAGGH